MRAVVTMINIAKPHVDKAEGISPITRRGDSGFSSIILCDESDTFISVSKFKLVFYKIIIYSFFLNQISVITCLNYPTRVNYNNSIGILNG